MILIHFAETDYIKTMKLELMKELFGIRLQPVSTILSLVVTAQMWTMIQMTTSSWDKCNMNGTDTVFIYSQMLYSIMSLLEVLSLLIMYLKLLVQFQNLYLQDVKDILMAREKSMLLELSGIRKLAKRRELSWLLLLY